MYSEIILCTNEIEDEILSKQIAMLKERHHAEVKRISSSDADDYISLCETTALFISENEELIAKAKNRGIATNTPGKMRESYEKAMEMLKSIQARGER